MTILKEKQRARTIEDLPITALRENPYGARRFFSREALSGLAKSIGQVGVLEPILVRKKGEVYQIVSGQRRVRASRLAGLRTVPCVVLSVSDRNCALFSLTENLQREELDLFEKANALQKLIDFYGMTANDSGLLLGLSDGEVKDKLKALNMGENERELCRQLGACEKDQQELAKIPQRKLRLEALERIAKGKMSWGEVKNIEEIISKDARKDLSIKKNNKLFADKELFFKTIYRACEILNTAGGSAKTETLSGESQTILVITIDN